LALTAALEHQAAAQDVLLLSCRGDFYTVIRDLLNRIAERDIFTTKETMTSEWSFTQAIGLKKGKTSEVAAVKAITSYNEAIAAIKHLCPKTRSPILCVFDEFELIEEAKDRRLYGDLIKSLSDQEIPLRIIFCGIGESVTALLDDHPSAPRYLTAVELSRLNWDARFEIMDGVERAMQVQLEHNTKMRIAQISDGFPHYIHLVCEKIFWEIFEDASLVNVSTVPHYKAAVAAAVLDAQPYLKSIYDKGVKKYRSDYEHVLWAAADHPNLERRSIDIFQSYTAIVPDKIRTLDRPKFNQRLNALKRESHGRVMVGTRQGWYKFRESMLRGYARLRAEQEGIDLVVDHPLASQRRTNSH